MPRRVVRILSLLLCFFLIFEQSGFAQVAGQLNVSGYLAQLRSAIVADKFRPLHLRHLSFEPNQNNFQLLLDKGDTQKLSVDDLKESSATLLKYFLIGVTLPNSSFWVNLRPDSAERIVDEKLGQTDIGKILLEADLQLKKDTARFTSPQTPEGKEYWDKLYKKASELFGSSDVTIPTLTRPWIVPDEIIVRETPASAYVYKATLKVMLEQDYLKDSAVYKFDDQRLKELNEYSSQLIRDLIIPKITKEINNSKRYAPLRQVYYSLILAQWFKEKCTQKNPTYAALIDQENLTDLTSQEAWYKTTYFNAYQQSFKNGEYNIKEPVNTLFGRSIRSYFSGGIALGDIGTSVIYVQGNPGNSLPVGEYLAGVGGVVGASAVDVELNVDEQVLESVDQPVQGEQVKHADQGFEGGITTLDTEAFDTLWEYSGREVTTPAEAGRIVNQRTAEHPEGFFGPDFHLPQIKLISRAEMDTLAPGQHAIRQGEQVLVVDSYWESLSDETTPESLQEGKDTKLNLLFHEAMAAWVEQRNAGKPEAEQISAEDIPMMIEGLFKDSQGLTRAQDQERQKAHQGIAIDRAMEGGDAINEEVRFSPKKILREFREWFGKQLRPKTEPVKRQSNVDKNRFVDLEHFVAAQMKLARGLLTGQLLQDVLISLDLPPTLTGEEATTQIYQRLIERNYPPEIINLINQGTYVDPRLEIEIEHQNKGPRLQSIMEAISNSLDAHGFHIGQFGKGIKQILYWLRANGVDQLKVVTSVGAGKAYQLTIIKSFDGRLRINIQEISFAEFQNVARTHTGRELEKGTILTVATIDPIPALDQESDKEHPVSQETIIRKIKERYPFVTAVDIYTQESGQQAQAINGFEDMAVIVPAEQSVRSTHTSQGRFVQVEVGKFSIAVTDNGSGMNEQTLARMFVPREGNRDSPQLDTPEAVQQELGKTKVVHCTGPRMPHRISFGRNGEVITAVDVPEDIVAGATVSGGLLVECAGLMDVTEARDNIVLQQNLRGGGKTRFQAAIEHLLEAIIAHPTLSAIEKVRYINTIIVGLDGLVKENSNNEFVVSALRARAGELLAPILRELEGEGYIILPHERTFLRLSVAHREKVIFLHEKLFQWQGAVSFRKLGAQVIPGITVGGDKRLPILVAVFTADSTQAIRNPDIRHLINLTQEERLPFIKQEGYMVISEELGKRLMELARRRGQLDPQEEKEFKSLMQRLNIVTAEEVYVSYEVAEVRPNVIIVDMHLSESAGELDSPAINQFLVHPPVLSVQEQKNDESTQQRLALSADGQIMEIGTGKKHKLFAHGFDSIEFLVNGYYLLRSSAEVTLVSFKNGVAQSVHNIIDLPRDSVRVSPDKKSIVVEDPHGRIKEVFSCVTGTEAIIFSPSYVYWGAQFSQDGQFLVCLTQHDKKKEMLQVYNLRTQGAPHQFILPKGKHEFQVNPFANIAFVRNTSSGAMRLIDLESGQSVEEEARYLHTNSAGTHTIVIEKDGTMGVYVHKGQLRKYITSDAFRSYQDEPRIVTVDTRWLLSVPGAKPYSIIQVADKKGSVRAWGLDADGNAAVVMPYPPGQSVVYETVALSGKKKNAVPVASCTFQPRTSGSSQTIAARLDRLDPLQRQEGAGIYKHPHFDLIINQVDPQNPMAIDPENDSRLSVRGEITWHWRAPNAPAEVCIFSYDGEDEYRSVSANTNRGLLQPAVKIDEPRKPVYDKPVHPKYEVYFHQITPQISVYYLSIFSDTADDPTGRSAKALAIDTEKYTAVSFDGKYFVFSDPKTGEAVYLNPQNPDDLRPVAWQPAQGIREEKPGEIAPPADARQKLALSADGQPMEIGSGKVHKLLDHGYQDIEHLFNDYYLLTSSFGVSLISFKGGTVQSIGNIGDLSKDQVLVAPNKKFLVVLNAGGSIEKIVDCEKGKVYTDLAAFSSIPSPTGNLQDAFYAAHSTMPLPTGNLQGPFYAAQFSRDGKYLTYLWKNADGLVFLVIFNMESKFACSVVDLEMGNLEYAINPFAPVAFVRNKDTGRMMLVDLEDRREIIADAKFLRADSMGKYVVIVSENNEVMLYSLPNHKLMGATHFGGNIHLLELQYRKGKNFYKITTEAGAEYYMTTNATASPVPMEEEVYSEIITPMAGSVTFFSRNQGVLVECRAELLDPLQRIEKEGVYKHPQFDLIIDNTALTFPLAIDPNSGVKYRFQGEIIGYDAMGLLNSWEKGQLQFSNNLSADLQKLDRPVWKDNAVPMRFTVQLFEGEYILLPYSPNGTQLATVQLQERGIDASKYTAVSFDGKYFIFVDPKTGEAVYLDPQNPDVPIFAAGLSQPQPQNRASVQQPPADTRGKHVLLQDQRIVEAGTGEEVKSIGLVAQMIPLENNCYLVNQNGSWDIVTLSWGKSSSMNQHPLTNNSSDAIRVSADKRLVVLTDSFGGVMEIYDCQAGRAVFSKRGNKAVHLPKFVKNGRIIAAQFTSDGALTYVDVNITQRTWNLYRYDPQTEESQLLITLPNPAELQYSVNPSANVAFVRNTASATMHLIDLAQRREVATTVPIKHLYTDSSGSFVAIVHSDDTLSVFHPQSGSLITKTLIGGKNIALVCAGHRLNGGIDIYLKDEQGGYHSVNGVGGLWPFTPPSDDQVLFVEYATTTSAIFAKKLTYGPMDWHSGLAFNPAQAIQFNLPLLDGLQRPDKQTVYKHLYLNLIIDERDQMHPVATDPITGNQFAYQGEIYGIRCDAQTGELDQLLSYDAAGRYESNPGSAAVSIVSSGKVVAADTVSGSSIIGFLGPMDYLLRPAYDKPSVEIKGIKPTTYDKVSFDGKYFVFANTLTGDLAYLNPQDPQNPIFVPIGEQPKPGQQTGIPQVPAQAQQGHILVDGRYVRQVGVGVVADLGPAAGNLQYLTNGYYRVTVGETDNIYKISGSTVENCFWVQKDKESMVISADKSMIVAVGEDGVIRMVFDCHTGKKYYLGQAGLSETEGTPVEKYHRPQFSKDGKYLTYLAVDTANPVPIGAGKVYQTALCVVDIDSGMQVTRDLSMEVGDDEWEYTLSPFAPLAYVRNKDNGTMALVDLKTGLVRTHNAKFMRTDSSGAYTVSIDVNDEVSIYPTGSSMVIDPVFFGNKKITSLSVSYYPSSRNIYTIKTEDGVEHYFFSDTVPVGLQPGQLPAGADCTEGIVPELSIVQFDYELDATAMNLTTASLQQLSGQEGLYFDPLFSLVIDYRDPANPVAIDPQTGKKFIFHGTIDFVQYGPEQNSIEPAILVESHMGRQAFFTDPDSTAEVFADFVAGESGSHYITKCQGSDGLSYYISAPQHATALKKIDVHKYTQVSFDGRCFLFVDPQSGDVAYLDPAGNQDAPIFIPASSSPVSAQQDEERVKKLLLWRDQVISQRDNWIAQARSAYQPFLEMIPAEFRPAIERALESQITELYRAQDEEIKARFTTAIENGTPVNLENLPFDSFLQRMERVKQALPQFLHEQEANIYQKTFEFRRDFYSAIFDTLFGLCLRQDIVIDAFDTALLEVIASGWQIDTQEQANLVPGIYRLIVETRNAHPNMDPSSIIHTIVRFLSVFAGEHPQVNCSIIATQLSKILKLSPKARTQHLQEMVKAFGGFSDPAILLAFAQGKAPDANLQDVWPFAVFLTNEVDQVPRKERFMPDGEDRFLAQDPDSEGIAISQIMLLEQMRPRQDDNDTVMSIDYLLEHISDLPELSEKLEQDIMRNITVQRESGASTAETAQNSGDGTKDMEDGELVISHSVQKGATGDEFVEEAQDNGTGALQEVALLIPKSTKAKGGQVDLAGFFGTGKYAIFEGVDRLEIITKNDSCAYLFVFQVIPDANGHPAKVRLVQIRQIHDARVQRGVTVRRIKSLDNTIPELDQMLSQRAWKTFCGLAQGKNFKIYFLDHEGNKRQLVVGSQKDPNHPEILCELEFAPGKKSADDKPVLRIYSTKDMPMQIVDRAGLRVREIPQEYLALIPESLRHFVPKLGMVIQIPLPLIRTRDAFVHEDEYLEEIQKYVAVAFYQALAFKTLTQTSPQFVFENFPYDWETNGAYWYEIHPDSDAELLQLAEKINTGRLEEIGAADLAGICTTGKKLDWEKKFVKLILLLQVATDPGMPQKKISLLQRRKAIQERVNAERAARQTRLLEGGGYSTGRTPDLADVPDAGEKIAQAVAIDLGHQQMEHPERYVVAPETAEEHELIELAESIAGSFGIEQVVLLSNEVGFAGAFKIFQGKHTMFLKRSIARKIGMTDSRAVQLDEATDTIVHELGHLVEQLVRENNAQGLWRGGYVAHLSNFTHDSVGTFAEAMKYVAAVSLAQRQASQMDANADHSFEGGITTLDTG
ncbi:MAG: hypothetical protein PHN59_00005, partial [Candidatus Omnitrophica bacterium]|nr:hypothetical protein [Candidatus Omnitrophota bacterium]